MEIKESRTKSPEAELLLIRTTKGSPFWGTNRHRVHVTQGVGVLQAEEVLGWKGLSASLLACRLKAEITNSGWCGPLGKGGSYSPGRVRSF